MSPFSPLPSYNASPFTLEDWGCGIFHKAAKLLA